MCSSVLLFVYTARLSVHSSITACAHYNSHLEHTVSTLKDPVYTSFNCCLTKCAQYVGRPVHTWSKCAMSTLVHTWDQVCTGKPADDCQCCRFRLINVIRLLLTEFTCLNQQPLLMQPIPTETRSCQKITLRASAPLVTCQSNSAEDEADDSPFGIPLLFR